VTAESRSTTGLQKKYPGLLMHSSIVSSIGADSAALAEAVMFKAFMAIKKAVKRYLIIFDF